MESLIGILKEGKEFFGKLTPEAAAKQTLALLYKEVNEYTQTKEGQLDATTYSQQML